MITLTFNDIIFVLGYIVYSIIMIIVINFFFIKRKYDCNEAVNLSEEQYFVLKCKNEYDIVFYYFTFRLYSKDILIRHENKKNISFSINKDKAAELNGLEQVIYKVYENGFEPRLFNQYTVDKNLLNNFYNSIYKNLKLIGLFSTYKEILSVALKVFFLSVLTIIPGIWICYSGKLSNSVLQIFIPIVFVVGSFLFAYLCMVIDGFRINKIGLASVKAYEKNFKKSLKDSGIDNIYVNYEERMGNFLFGCWGKVLGVENGSSTNLP